MINKSPLLSVAKDFFVNLNRPIQSSIPATLRLNLIALPLNKCFYIDGFPEYLS